MQDVKAYLTRGGSYDEGVLLYNQYGDSDMLKRMFAKGQDDYNVERLTAELIAICERDTPINSKAEEFVPISKPVLEPVVNNDLPEKLKAWRLKNVPLIREANRLHAQLALMPTNAERYNACLIIRHNWDQIELCWAHINYWQKHKRLHPDLQPKVSTKAALPGQLIITRNNLRASISKWRTKVETRTGAKQLEAKQKLQELLDELKEVDKKLNA